MKNNTIISRLRLALIKQVASICAKNDNYRHPFLNAFLSQYQEVASEYVRYRVYPKKSDAFNQNKLKTNTRIGEWAIVFQGPIDKSEDFQLETVKLYKKMFPQAVIIISTWENEPEDVLNKFRELGCELVINKTFRPNGQWNVNYQLCTTLNGLKRAKELGVKYALKHRGDWRIYREGSYEYLKSLLNWFPVAKDNPFNLNKRILYVGGGEHPNSMIIPYWIQDFFFFGNIDDLISYFSTPYDKRQIDDINAYIKEHFEGKSLAYRDCAIPSPEIYMAKSFVNRHQRNPQDTKHYWLLLKKIFINVDVDTLAACWHKYDHYMNLNVLTGDIAYSFRPENVRGINASDWMNILSGNYIYEQWMDDLRK